MSDHTTSTPFRVFQESSHASLCALGQQLERQGILAMLDAGCTIHQKRLRYTPAEKVRMLFAGILTGVTGLAQMNTLRADRALHLAFAIPGWAEQSVLSDTLSAATDADVAHLRTASETILRRCSQALAHDFAAAILTLDLDLSPAPVSKRYEGSVKSYQGQAHTTYGRKLIRVVARLTYGEVLWEDVIPGNRNECLALVKEAVTAIERLFGIADPADPEDTTAAAAAARTRSRIEWRVDSGWGIDAVITFLLARGYHITGKFHTHTRITRLTKAATDWTPARQPRSAYAVVTDPVVFERPVQQLVARVPSTTAADGYAYTVVFSSRTELAPLELLAHYDDRAGMEAEIKSDKRGLGLVTIRKHHLPAQRLLVLLIDLAHNVLTWARSWLAIQQPRLGRFGIIRLVRDIWAIPGRVKIKEHAITRIILRPGYPHADQLTVLVDILLTHDIPAFLGQT